MKKGTPGWNPLQKGRRTPKRKLRLLAAKRHAPPADVVARMSPEKQLAFAARELHIFHHVPRFLREAICRQVFEYMTDEVARLSRARMRLGTRLRQTRGSAKAVARAKTKLDELDAEIGWLEKIRDEPSEQWIEAENWIRAKRRELLRQGILKKG